MPRKHLRRWLPDRETLHRNAFLRRIAPWLQHPNLWHLNRHSVAGGVAIGLFCGLIPGPLQVLTATLAALLWRVNLPVAIFTTFYTNPFTIVPLYLVAFTLGRFITGATGQATVPPAPPFDWAHLIDTARAWADWASALGLPLAIGLVALASLLAVAGYAAVQLGWRLHIHHALHQRRKRRAAA